MRSNHDRRRGGAAPRSGKAFSPDSPEAVESVLGVFASQYRSRSLGAASVVYDLPWHAGGPTVNSFWLDRTLLAEAGGQIRKGKKRIADQNYVVTFDGDLAVSTLVYNGRFDNFGSTRTTGLWRSPEAPPVDPLDPAAVRQLLARGVFNLLHPSILPAYPSYDEIKQKSLENWRQSEVLRRQLQPPGRPPQID